MYLSRSFVFLSSLSRPCVPLVVFVRPPDDSFHTWTVQLSGWRSWQWPSGTSRTADLSSRLLICVFFPLSFILRYESRESHRPCGPVSESRERVKLHIFGVKICLGLECV